MDGKLIQVNNQQLQFAKSGNKKQSSKFTLKNVHSRKVLFRVLSDSLPQFILIPSFSTLEPREQKEIKVFFTGASWDVENPVLQLESVEFDLEALELTNERKVFWIEKKPCLKQSINLFPKLDSTPSLFSSGQKSSAVQSVRHIYNYEQNLLSTQNGVELSPTLNPQAKNNQPQRRSSIDELSGLGLKESKQPGNVLDHQFRVKSKSHILKQDSPVKPEKSKEEQEFHRVIVICLGGLLMGAFLKHFLMHLI